jgi:3-oxoacyl-[acyl-carrier protein] reductase
VTGASRGIGRAVALAFAREGMSIVPTGRDSSALESLAEEARTGGVEVLPVTADLTIEPDIDRIAREAIACFDRVDILVNNAGVIHAQADLVDMEASAWRQTVDVNLTAVALLTKAVLPSMIEHRSGKIINISSSGGRRGGRGRSAYRASKAAVINLTESVAAEVKQFGIDVNCVCPGGVDTEGWRALFTNVSAERAAEQPVGMQPVEIAEVVLFLASDAASAITGTSIDAMGPTNPLFARLVRDANVFTTT